MPSLPASRIAAAVPVASPSQKSMTPQMSGFCCNMVVVDIAGGRRVPVRVGLGDHLEIRMLRQDLHDAGILIEARGVDLVALNEADLLRGAFAAALDDGFRLELAQPVPIAADESVGRIVGGIVDQNHIDALFLRLLEELRVGIEIGRMHDQHVGLGIRCNGLGDRLGARLDAPVGVAGLELAAETIRPPCLMKWAQPCARSKPMAIGTMMIRLPCIASL